MIRDKILTTAQRQQFAEEGYLVLEQFLEPERDFAPLLSEQAQILNELAAKLQREGLISSGYSDRPFVERLIKICAESGKNFPQNFDITFPFAPGSIQPDTPIHAGPAVFGLLTNSRLLDLAEELVGPEIYSNPVQHIRMKLPKTALTKEYYNPMLAKVSWHQDNGVILPEADATNLLTVWLPLTEATEANGCLAVLPGSHKLGLLQHCQTSKDVAIPDELLPPIPPRPLPMKPGDVLLMSKLMVHSSLDNVTTGEVRISADLRYQPVGQPTGRPAFAEAGFIARSQAHPDRVLSDPTTWAENWYKLRDQLVAQKDAAYYRTNRWRPGGVCA